MANTNIYTVDKSTTLKIARGFTLYQYRQPKTLLLLAIIVAMVVLISPNLRHNLPLAIVVALVTLLITPFLTYRQVKKQLLRGFLHPGATLTAEFTDTGFKVSTEHASAENKYSGLQSIAVLGSAVVLRQKNSKIAIILPRQLVPEPRIAYIQQVLSNA